MCRKSERIDAYSFFDIFPRRRRNFHAFSREGAGKIGVGRGGGGWHKHVVLRERERRVTMDRRKGDMWALRKKGRDQIKITYVADKFHLTSTCPLPSTLFPIQSLPPILLRFYLSSSHSPSQTPQISIFLSPFLSLPLFLSLPIYIHTFFFCFSGKLKLSFLSSKSSFFHLPERELKISLSPSLPLSLSLSPSPSSFCICICRISGYELGSSQTKCQRT